MVIKVCTKCKNIKFNQDFVKYKHSKDGLNKWCKSCHKQYRIDNKENIKNYYLSIKESKKQYDIEYREKNRKKLLLQMKKYSIINDLEIKKYKKEYAKENVDKMRHWKAKRHTAKLQRIPKWLTKEQYKEIYQWYKLAKELQWLSDSTDPLEVDHIVPLQGKNVSGLHVPWNLQILPKSLNCSKCNRFEEVNNG